ncbi:MAG: hypothetical protein PCFJNLEI_04007 [Verrucomicrobiae bacterium]|nr:hypothetical protein [Verrucomicrobiae bacterium]
MEKLDLPSFAVPPLPKKQIPWRVVDELNDELVQQLKRSGEYERLRNSPQYRSVPVRFTLE